MECYPTEIFIVYFLNLYDIHLTVTTTLGSLQHNKKAIQGKDFKDEIVTKNQEETSCLASN